MTPTERLNAIFTHEKINAKQFSEELGFTRPQRVYDILNGKAKSITDDFANKILSRYNYYNRVWLLTGIGEMLNTEITENTEKVETAELVPLVPLSAMAGKLTGFALDGVTLQDCELIKSPIKGVDFAVPVTGDSMSPEYPNGSRVLVQEINPHAFIEWGKVYVLDTCNGIVIKQLRKSEKEGYVSCYSINDNSIFAPFDVPLADVHGIYRVLLCLALK